MNRRTFLGATAGAAAGLAGCNEDQSGTESSRASPSPSGGGSASTGTPGDVDPSSFERLSVGNVQVPLVPVDVAHAWYQQNEGDRFVDARGERQYEDAHVTGAVLSSARRVEDWSQPRNGPTADWSKDARIVCYCGCPHHLSSLRAGEFISKGYERVYAIDEGFFEWRDRGYPVTGGQSSDSASVIRGQADPAHAGEYAWATDATSDRMEAAPIAEDGSYELALHFTGLEPTSPIRVETPGYEITAPLSDLTADVVTGP